MKTLFGFLSLLLAASASAQFDPPANPNSASRAIAESDRLYRLDVAPQASWYNPASSGSGWYFDRVSTGPGVDIVSAIGFIYQRDGRQAFALGNAPRPTLNSTAARMWANAAIMALDLNLVETRDGSCPTCAYQRPETGPGEFNRARVEWIAPTVARLRVNDSDLPDLIASDVALVGGLANRIAGRHYGTWQSRSQFNAGFPINRSECIIEWSEVPKPFSESALQFEPGTVMNEQPPAGARWFRAAFACGASLPADNVVPEPSRYFLAIAADTGAAYGVQYVLGDINAVRDATGNILTYRIIPRTPVGRIYATGTGAHYWPLREAQDSSIVSVEYTMRRSR
ncbi:hypothetical protein [Dolichospermum phage Dfl-JY14]